jgi:hypothetical protein|tara:strand:- start:218 stop:793 length:576 start_codon:yes stop_codon:yes gene_type:complete
MNFKKIIFFFSMLVMSISAYASGTMNENEIKNIDRIEVSGDEMRQRLSITAGLLTEYEIEAKKLVSNLNNGSSTDIRKQASTLLELSENVISSAQYRLPQCDEYLAKTLMLKNNLQEISLENLEKDYHHDGALPKAPSECYHTKDLFVHPATVIVLTRDNPVLNEAIKSSIHDEITEVLAHTEIVRQLIIY